MVEDRELGIRAVTVPTGDPVINIRIILTLLAGTLFFLLLLRWQGRQLNTAASPAGIVSLELAATAEKTSAILNGWEKQKLTGKARNNIMIDFLFIPFYALLFYTLCGSISVQYKGRAATVGVLLAFCALIAGLFDVVENLLMLLGTFSGVTPATAALTAFFASAKFFLLVISLVYVALLGLPLLLKKLAS